MPDKRPQNGRGDFPVVNAREQEARCGMRVKGARTCSGKIGDYVQDAMSFGRPFVARVALCEHHADSVNKALGPAPKGARGPLRPAG